MPTRITSAHPLRAIVRRNASVCIISSLLLAMLTGVSCHTAAGDSNDCVGNLDKIYIALQGYHAVYGANPPRVIRDSQGKEMHSWRVLLLPFLGDDAAKAYKRYKFTEAWDGPSNRKLEELMPVNYRCPTDKSQGAATSYLMVENDAKSGARGNGIILVEVTNSPVHWMEPRDISFDEVLANGVNCKSGRCISSGHKEGGAWVYVNGWSRFVPDDVSQESLRAFLTGTRDRNGNWPPDSL